MEDAKPASNKTQEEIVKKWKDEANGDMETDLDDQPISREKLHEFAKMFVRYRYI